jgi:purine-binding chemotaxis protein CheW
MTKPPAQGRVALDWKEARQRLARAIAATDEAGKPSPERARQVLAERARTLARVPPQAAGAEDTLEVITFTLAGETYGLETAHVREVLCLTEYTPVPGAPDFLLGVLNLRGEILAVIDLRRFLGAAARGVTDLVRVIVLGGERAEFGVLADSVLEVRSLPLDQVLPPPDSVEGVGRQYLRGVTPEALIVLDAAVLLRDGRLFIDQADEPGR